MTRGQLSCTEDLFRCFYCHRQRSCPNHMLLCVVHWAASAIRHAGNMAAQTASRYPVKAEPIQTVASDKCLPFVLKEDPMMSWLPRQYTRISGLFLMHGWNHIQGRKEAFHHKNLPKPRSFHADVFFQIFRNFINVPPNSERGVTPLKNWVTMDPYKWVSFKMSLCPCPPPLVVLRQRVSSPAYLSVLYSRPPLRQRTRVYYSLQ